MFMMVMMMMMMMIFSGCFPTAMLGLGSKILQCEELLNVKFAIARSEDLRVVRGLTSFSI